MQGGYHRIRVDCRVGYDDRIMPRYAAFLRGMNLGKRRITNVELCAAFESLGLSSPTAFLASGNIAFGSDESEEEVLAERIESGLADVLGYPVPTFLRGAEEVRRIADRAPFAPEIVAESAGKLQVAILSGRPSGAACRRVLARATDEDRLALEGRELYWLPSAGILDSVLDWKAIEVETGPFTMRTHRTLVRLAAKLLAA